MNSNETPSNKALHASPPQSCLALDIGCGEGSYLETLSEKGYTTVGLDINRQRLKKASKISSVILASCKSLPFKEKIFDLVSMQYIIHHISMPDQTLQEVSRISKPQGILMVAELVEDNPLFRLGRNLHPIWENDPVYTRLYRSGLRQLLGTNGLIVEEDLSLGHFWWLWWIIATQFVASKKVDTSKLNKLVSALDKSFGNVFNNQFSCKYNATLRLKEAAF